MVAYAPIHKKREELTKGIDTKGKEGGWSANASHRQEGEKHEREKHKREKPKTLSECLFRQHPLVRLIWTLF